MLLITLSVCLLACLAAMIQCEHVPMPKLLLEHSDPSADLTLKPLLHLLQICSPSSKVLPLNFFGGYLLKSFLHLSQTTSEPDQIPQPGHNAMVTFEDP